MANKRELKRTINCVCSELLAECIAYSQYAGKTDDENLNALVRAIININNDSIRKVSHPEPGMPPKMYFEHVIKQFEKHIVEITDQISNIN